jgi:hypothetical protein
MMANQYTKRKPIEWEIDGNNCYNCTSHSMDKGGYPKIKIMSKVVLMNRFIYAECFGDIPEGMLIRHKCDNPSCINPEHLEIGTHADNMSDMVERHRQRPCRGELHGMSKLTWEQIVEIRKDTRCYREIAKIYDVSINQVGRIKRRESWNE